MIRVFIIDDSMLVRNSIAKLLKNEEEITVIGEAPNPVDAMDIFKKVGFPDVFILDIEMPKMDGLTFLKKVNEQNPTPVVICSTLVSLGSSTAIDALRLGASEIIQKPLTNIKEFFEEQREELVQAIKAAARAKVFFKPNITEVKNKEQLRPQKGEPSSRIIALGSSTGGVQVIEEIVKALRSQHQGIVITQHMPEGFTKAFANRLDGLTSSFVKEAEDGDTICDNMVIIAKGARHMEVIQEGKYLKVRVRDFPKVNSHKPSVNVLFKSIAKLDSKNHLAFILTGMGDDGASGIKAMKEKGNLTYGQIEKECVVYGMPSAAKKLGGLCLSLSIHEIIMTINQRQGVRDV